MEKTEVKNEANEIIAFVSSYQGFPKSRSKTNRPGSRGNTLRTLWAVAPIKGRTIFGFVSRTNAIKYAKTLDTTRLLG